MQDESLREEISLSFERHRGQHEVTIERYLRQRQLELARSLADKFRIYLDIRFWIILRDVELGRITDVASVSLYDRLKTCVRKGLALCPISESVLLELLKQSDLVTRRATAALVDELSLGVTLISADIRLNTEVAHFLYSNREPNSVEPLDHLVWTKLAYVLGASHPTNTPFDAEQERMLQKAFVDHMWDRSLVEMIDQLAKGEGWQSMDMDGIAQRLNNGIAEHAGELKSFKQAYKAEAFGAASVVALVGLRVLEDMYERDHGSHPPRSEASDDHERMMTALLANALILGKARGELPSLHVVATCHAAIRWNKGQKLDGNHLYDFHHAAAALGFCDVFLTDGPMRALLTANHVALDKELSCEVFSTARDAVAYLEVKLQPTKN